MFNLKLFNNRNLDRELIPLKLILALTSSLITLSLLLPGNSLDQSQSLKIINELFDETCLALYFFAITLLTSFGLYNSNKYIDMFINTINIITWGFLSISMYFAIYPHIPIVNSAYSVLTLIAIWVYSRSNLR